MVNIEERMNNMSRYGDCEKDDMSYELDEFLKTNSISELLDLVKDSVERKEEGYLN